MGWLSRWLDKRRRPAQAPAPDVPAVEAPAPAPALPADLPVAGGHPAIDALAARDLRADSPEFDEFIARAALEAGTDLPHGAQHLANLLIVDPAHPRWRALLDR